MRNLFHWLRPLWRPSGSRGSRRSPGFRPSLEALDSRIVPSTLSIGDYSAIESEGMWIFEVKLSEPSTEPVTVDFTTVGGTAKAGQDFKATAGTLTFEPGQTTAFIYVPVHDDLKVEPDEYFSVNLSNATNAAIADGQALGWIFNNDVDDHGGGGRQCHLDPICR